MTGTLVYDATDGSVGIMTDSVMYSTSATTTTKPYEEQTQANSELSSSAKSHIIPA